MAKNVTVEESLKISDILAEECQRYYDQIVEAVTKRIHEEIGEHITVKEPKRGPWPYAAWSGPKPLGDGRYSPDAALQMYVLPLADIEYEIVRE